MKIVGANLRGVNLTPQIEKELQVSKHKWGCQATVSFNTDQIKDDYAGKEIIGFKNNFNLHAYVSPIYNDNMPLKDIYQTGLIDMGIYYQTEFWQNPVTKNIEAISDYPYSVWSQNALNSGLITSDLVGTTKQANYPNNGQELYDQSNGKYGYDFINNRAGEIDTLTPTVKYYLDWYKTRFGKYPSTASLGYGRTQPLYVLKDYSLGVRSSGHDDVGLYDFTKEEAIGKGNTTRLDTYIINQKLSVADAILKANDILENVITNGGWYNDFTHWQLMLNGEYTQFLDSQKAVIGNRDIANLSTGEALEYMLLRRMVKKAGYYTQNNELKVLVYWKDFEVKLLDRITTEISIELDTTGTILEGKEIIGNCKIRKKGINRFIVQIPYNQKDGFSVVSIKETTAPNYIELTPPNVTLSGTTVTTNRPCKVVVYNATSGATIDTVKVVERFNEFNINHTITLLTGDNYIGAIDENGQANLAKI